MIAVPLRKPLSRRALIKGAVAAALVTSTLIRPTPAQIIQFSGANPVSQWVALDGRLNAPTGTANYPNALTSYKARPPWFVSGVDYRVGINTGVVLKDPATDTLPPNCSRSGTTLTVSGTTTIDGWNFDGWAVEIMAGAPTVTNCSFVRGLLTVIHTVNGGTATGLTCKYCVFDQQGLNGPGGNRNLFIIFRPGTYIVQYCWFINSYHMHFQQTEGDFSTTLDFRYNLLDNCGLGAPITGAHGDFTQIFGAEYSNLLQDFNMVIQTNTVASTQGWSINAGPPEVITASVNNNTMIIAANTDVNYAVILAEQWIINNIDVIGNYADITGVTTDFLQPNSSFPGPDNGTITFSSNTNMVTGGVINPSDP